jgi:DNA gyrase subunit A
VFISQNGMVQRTSVRGISKYGRASQGVRVMNLREDDVVSAVALVMETNTSAQVQDELAEGEEETLAAVGDGADGETPEAAVDDTDDAEPEADEGDDDAAEDAEPEPDDADE